MYKYINQSTFYENAFLGECDGRDRKKLHNNRVYKEL